MKAKQSFLIRLGLCLALLTLLAWSQSPADRYPVKAQEEVWTIYTNGNHINDLAVEGDYLWAATEGGVVRWDTRDNSYIKYTRRDGLVDNNVQEVAVDLDGSKWFGAYDEGVSHFDGTTWTTYNSANSPLVSDYIYTITIAANGDKWFGGIDGVSHFDGNSWQNYTSADFGLPFVSVEAIAIDTDGSKWFGTFGRGVYHFDGVTWNSYTTANSPLASNYVEVIAIDANGGKWFGTGDAGVSYFDGNGWEHYDYASVGVGSTIQAIAIDNDGVKWFGAPGGVTRFDDVVWTTYTTANSGLTGDWVNAIATDDNGVKWFGLSYNSAGINKFDNGNWETPLITADGLVGNDVFAVSFENSGGRWFGAKGGAGLLVGKTWVNYTPANSPLEANQIEAVAIDVDNNKWFGTYDKGVKRFDGVTWTTYNTANSDLSSNFITVVAIDMDGNKWIGAAGGGVNHFNGSTWDIYNTSNSNLLSDYIEAITMDTDGSIWVGTSGGGVSHFKQGNWTTYTTADTSLVSDWVHAIAIDVDGSKWFGTRGGVNRFDGSTWTTYTSLNSPLIDNWINTIAIDDSGAKWFGTSSGVSRFDNVSWQIYNPSNSSLTDDWIKIIAIDRSGTKWFGTESGLSRLGPPPESETYLRVADEDGNPLPGAWVYRNGSLIANEDNIAYPTNFLGLMLIDDLNPADRLITLAPRYKQSTLRAGHGPGQDWAFQINTTNLEIDNNGNITTVQAYDPATNEYLLTTRRDNTLVTFNLLISIEWDATDDYIKEIEQAAKEASDYLFDLTDGQMAFGQVAIHDNSQYWADADIQISTKNIVHPHAYIGGIISNDKAHVIRLGRGWNGRSGNQGPWDQPDGFRTLAHEFGHYALHLYDEYFVYLFDANGNLVSTKETICTGPENRVPATEAANASAMDWQYSSTELSARGVPGLWSTSCEQTAQWQLNKNPNTGEPESTWETLARMYADPLAGSPRWHIITPLERGSMLIEPRDLPDEFLALPLVTKHNAGISGPPIPLTVYGPDHQGYWGAIVALYKQDGRVIGQGFTGTEGEILIYGADQGDTIRAASFDSGLDGDITVSSQANLSLFLSPVSSSISQAITQIPHLRIVAEPGQNPNQIDLLISLQNFGSGANPSLTIAAPGDQVGYSPPVIPYNPTTGTYEVEVSFSAAKQGTGHIRTVGEIGNNLVRLQSSYRLQQVVNNQDHEVYSDDGNLSLYMEPGSLPGNEAYFVVMPPGAIPGPLPPGLVLVGDAYNITASGALVTLEQPAILTARYDQGLVNQSSAPAGLALYRWDPNNQTWPVVSAELDENHRQMVAPVTTLGTYALLAPPGPWNRPSGDLFLPIILKP